MNDRETEQDEVRQQELRARQNEKAQLKIDRHEKIQKLQHKIAWYLSMPIALFAIVLVIDGLLPAKTHHENILGSFQENKPADKGHIGQVRTFIKTEHYNVAIPEGASLNFSGKNDQRTTMTIYVTPVFKIPVEFTLSNNSSALLEVPRTIHTIGFPLKWILLISCLLTLIMKDFTKFSYAVCFFPAVLFAIVLLIM